MGLLGGGGVLNSSVIFGQVLLSVIENMILIHGMHFQLYLGSLQGNVIENIACEEKILMNFHSTLPSSTSILE